MERVNLSTFRSTGGELTPRMLRALAPMNALRTVQLEDTSFHPSADGVSALPPISSVVNVSLILNETADHRLLELLALFVRVRTAVVEPSPDDRPTALPYLPPNFATRCNPFRSLERLDLMNIPLSSVPQFHTWIATCASQIDGLQLTHVRLCCEPGLDQVDLMALVAALSSALLRVLGLGCIRYAGLDLIDRLAEPFPMLEALTLIRLMNGQNFRLTPCPWPHTTWEYAPRFSRFQHLQYFAWNFRVDAEGGCILWDLPHIEVNCPVTDVPSPHDTADDDFGGLRAVAKLFMVHCQSLQRVNHVSGSGIVHAVEIRGHTGGTMVSYYRCENGVAWLAVPDEYYPPRMADRTHSWYFE
ncbi:hypothetical protein CERSUDRAFT_97889 [Gelatoporia subvermispora B]|uniref:F-box domain-containing protein n=1 Tax=Ceriporiopsis subvermispora (strain B) TaxID=914234 RepID=M2PDS1_CERS8|nr:hypothetical protein CERSUDRAFT_97889 [Gelatoporia subvermispora B]